MSFCSFHDVTPRNNLSHLYEIFFSLIQLANVRCTPLIKLHPGCREFRYSSHNLRGARKPMQKNFVSFSCAVASFKKSEERKFRKFIPVYKPCQISRHIKTPNSCRMLSLLPVHRRLFKAAQICLSRFADLSLCR